MTKKESMHNTIDNAVQAYCVKHNLKLPEPSRWQYEYTDAGHEFGVTVYITYPKVKAERQEPLTSKEEEVCLQNIQCYVDRIEFLKANPDYDYWDLDELYWDDYGPGKTCNLCRSFKFKYGDEEANACAACPLGPELYGCHVYGTEGGRTYIDDDSDWYCAGIDTLQNRLDWLLMKYKRAGLDIEITEE